MIKSVTVTNYVGDSIKLRLREPEYSGFLIKSISGLGPAKADINSSIVATMDGEMFNSSRMDKRNIVLDLIFADTVNKESIEEIRHKSYKYFPLKRKVELLIETDKRKVKAIGYVESNEPNIFSSQESTKISIVCPDPYLYSSDMDVTNFYSIEPMFEFEFGNESLTDPLLVMSEIKLITEGYVRYSGDADIGMTIRIHALAPASNITIYNIETREQMKIDTAKIEAITGKGIVSKDDLIITTLKGNKSVTLIREGVSYNVLNCLSRDADWFKLSRGDNHFAFTAESGISNLQISIENNVIYEGV